MKKIFIILFIGLGVTFLWAKVDYSEMSTQELIAIMGYVDKKNEKDFVNELKSRIPTMNENELEKYKKNLEKNKEQ